MYWSCVWFTGPLLFSIHINDNLEVGLPRNCQCVLNTDDFVPYTPVSDPDDFLTIQSDLDSLKKWSQNQYLQLNPTKCKYMLLCRRRLPSTATCILYTYVEVYLNEYNHSSILVSSLPAISVGMITLTVCVQKQEMF